MRVCNQQKSAERVCRGFGFRKIVIAIVSARILLPLRGTAWVVFDVMGELLPLAVSRINMCRFAKPQAANGDGLAGLGA
jgi:hypothetical protein